MSLFEPLSKEEQARAKKAMSGSGKKFPRTIPEGEYVIVGRAAEVNEKDQGLKATLMVEFQVLGPVNKGFKWRQWFVLKNPNDKAVQIGRARLTELASAMGKERFQNAAEAVGIPFCAQLIIRESDNPQYPESMEIAKAWANSTPLPAQEAEENFEAPWR